MDCGGATGNLNTYFQVPSLVQADQFVTRKMSDLRTVIYKKKIIIIMKSTDPFTSSRHLAYIYDVGHES